MYHQLTARERYQIEFLLSRGKKRAEIARELGRHRSTVVREIQRNGLMSVTEGFVYDAVPAQNIAQERRKEACEQRYKVKGDLEKYLAEKLACDWSPDQIAGRLKLESGARIISKSSIYRFIAKDKAEVFSKRYYQQLRCFIKRKKRVSRPRASLDRMRRSIRERPKACDERLNVGHLERDLMEGKRGKKAVLVTVDRKTRRVMLALVHKNSRSVQKTTKRILARPKVRALSITNDNGAEFRPDRTSLAERALGVKIYYCDPSSPWQRGTVENAIGLLRQYFPKRTDFTGITPSQLKRVEGLLNDRPRKTLNYRTPSEIYFEQLE